MTDEQVAKRVEQLTRIDQQLTLLLQQKQQYHSQLSELTHASDELARTSTAYKIIGSIMVESDKTALAKDLGDKKELIELRIKSIEKQEDTLRSEAEKIREGVFK